MDSPPHDWPEGPTLLESIWRYRWLVVAAALVGGLLGFAWSSAQPVRYQGEVRLFLNTGGDQSADPARIVRSQAEFLTSPGVLDRAVALHDGPLTRQELRERLTVEPASDADVIAIRVLEATPQGAATLADTVVRAYREVVAEQTNAAAQQEAAALGRRQQQLESEIARLDEQRRAQPANPRLQANRDAKIRQLNDLADQSEAARREAARANRSRDTLQEQAAVPEERTQPKPLRTAAIGAVLMLVAAAALAWWLNGREGVLDRIGRELVALKDRLLALKDRDEKREKLGPAAFLRLRTPFRDGPAMSPNGTPAGNGFVGGIADFDRVATSVQQLFHFLDGPPQRLYEEDLPQLAAEEMTQWFQVDLAVVLLSNGDEIPTIGSVGLSTANADADDEALRNLIEETARSGPRLLGLDELRRLTGTGLAGEQAGSFALVPLIRDKVAFGVLLVGRRGTDEQVNRISEREVEEIAAGIQHVIPFLWAWRLLRALKLRLEAL